MALIDVEGKDGKVTVEVRMAPTVEANLATLLTHVSSLTQMLTAVLSRFRKGA